VVLNERRSWASAFDLQTMACVLGFGIFICGCNEGDNQILEGCEELNIMLVAIFISFSVLCQKAC
jgi:hypothetical protein